MCDSSVLTAVDSRLGRDEELQTQTHDTFWISAEELQKNDGGGEAARAEREGLNVPNWLETHLH